MNEFQKDIERYLDLIPTENWQEELRITSAETLELYQQLTEEQADFAYAEGK